ncbi:MAG: DUF2249 domain-containing protein [Alphaproteobacteria bacterium]|nr:DUF2249 domain-containing protein [Alphaproteobacteria bacterium]
MSPRPSWVDQALKGRVVEVDVGRLLAEGVSPFMPIMGALEEAGLDGALVLRAPFDPLPIRSVLADKDVACFAEMTAPGAWRVICRRGAFDGVVVPRLSELLGAKLWREDDRAHIDVRGLPPPEPARAILSLIETVEAPREIIAHLDRDPVFLYPEIEARGWTAAPIPSEAGVVRLRLLAPKA